MKRKDQQGQQLGVAFCLNFRCSSQQKQKPQNPDSLATRRELRLWNINRLGCLVDHAKTILFSQDHSTKPAGCCKAMESLCHNQKTHPMRPCLS